MLCVEHALINVKRWVYTNRCIMISLIKPMWKGGTIRDPACWGDYILYNRDFIADKYSCSFWHLSRLNNTKHLGANLEWTKYNLTVPNKFSECKSLNNCFELGSDFSSY